MMLHEPYLQAAALSKDGPYARSLETVASIVDSVYHISQTMNANDALQAPEPLTPGGALCIYYAARLLIVHGGVVLNGTGVQWMVKVQSFRRSLEIFRRRWSVAGKLIISESGPGDEGLFERHTQLTSKQ